MWRCRAPALRRSFSPARSRSGARTIRDPGYRVNAGERITVAVPAPEPAEPAGESIPLNILFEDDEMIVIDKPAGLVVHPAAGHATGTLVNALIAHCGDSLSGIGGVKRPGIVHRLDKDTTGLMVVAKTDRAHQALAAQFADHGRTGPLERGYLAFVWGAPDRPKGTSTRRSTATRQRRDKMAVRAGGRDAITHWRVPETSPARKRQAGGEPGRLPAGDRPHPPDPGPPGPRRPSPARRRNLWHRLQDQGRAAAAGARAALEALGRQEQSGCLDYGNALFNDQLGVRWIRSYVVSEDDGGLRHRVVSRFC